MCGFAGVFDRPPGISPADLSRMTDTLTHRGPDDQGTWRDEEAGIALGFRRLAIVELSDLGHQPMASRSGRYVLTFNGEVYNHRELRHELSGAPADAGFRGTSDTETILAAFERWGIQASLRRFIGMFAIAVWDRELRRLTLARDRLGIKPLHVYQHRGRVMFASELKALMAAPGFDASLDAEGVAEYLRLLYVPAPASVFKHVRKLLPGHTLTIGDPSAELPDMEPYWAVDEVAREGLEDVLEGSSEELADRVEELLLDSVRLRLQADVPVGALLSGGIDSSTVVALAQAASDEPVRTYSIGFDSGEFNEAPAARRVAEHLGTSHTELMLTGKEALELVPELPRIFDEPLANPSGIPTYLICALARREVTVALTGDGGDEVFGGYHRYIEGSRIIPRLAGLPRPARRMAGSWIRGVPASTWDRMYRSVAGLLPGEGGRRRAGEKVAKVGSLLSAGSSAEMYAALMAPWHGGSIPASLRGAPSRTVRDRFDSSSGLELLDRMMLTDQATYLPDDLLAKVDRASMATSLEVRVPLLDHRVLALAWRLPRDEKVRGRTGKAVLRRILRRHVPDELFERPKMGFTVPIAEWLRGPLREYALDMLPHGGDDVGPGLGELRAAWDRFEAGEDGLANGIWAAVTLAAWRDAWSV